MRMTSLNSSLGALGVLAVYFSVSIAASPDTQPTSQPTIPRKTGNLTIDRYRREFLEGKQPSALDALLADPTMIKFMGATGIEDYVTLDILEPIKGQFNFAPYIANGTECRQLGIQ